LRIFKHFKYGPALPLGLALCLPFAQAQDRSSAPAIVTRNCSGCHEIDGRSQLPYIPRLAGQNAAYLERKLGNFHDASSSPVDEAVSLIVRGSRDQGFTRPAAANMFGIAHAISEQDLKAAAEWYAAQPPAPGRSVNSKLLEQGRSVFMNGLQSQGLAACQTCHGAEGQGSNLAPRLAGQNAGYLVTQLALFRAGDPHHSPNMTAVAKNMEGDQARAVAVYLQSR
jgi:cytochrome c553